MKAVHSYDVIILGGGPAGLTAAIYLGRARYRVVVLDTGTIGGQTVISYHVANYPGVEKTTGYAISQTMLRQAKTFGADVHSYVKISDISLVGNKKQVITSRKGTFEAPIVILATGGKPRTLGFASEKKLVGKGISYCATCDGDFFTDQPIAVIGGGNSALEEAISLTKYASKVTVIHEFNTFQAESWAVEEASNNPKIHFLMNQSVTDFESISDENGEELTDVLCEDKATKEKHKIPVNGCFIFIGYLPNVPKEFVENGLELNHRGEVLADQNMATNLAGVFAAGDLREKRYRQITTAVSDGTIAALSAATLLRS